MMVAVILTPLLAVDVRVGLLYLYACPAATLYTCEEAGAPDCSSKATLAASQLLSTLSSATVALLLVHKHP